MGAESKSAHAFGQGRFAQFLNRPAQRYSLVDHSRANAGSVGYFSDGHWSTLYLQRSTWTHACGSRRASFPLAAICALLGVRGPSHISWLVVPILVWVAINRHGWIRRPSDVSQECAKALAPCVTNRDAATAVVLERFYPRVVAALLHLTPSAVFLGGTFFCWGCGCLTMRFATKASTALSGPSAQGAGKYERIPTAVTPAAPSYESSAVGLWPLMRNDESTIPTSSQIMFFHPSL